MNQTELNLLEALQNLPVSSPIEFEYRFYYDETGRITTCSSHNHQESGQYVVVTEEQYNNSHKYEIRDNKLFKIPNMLSVMTALKKSTSGFRVVKNNPALIIEDNETYTEIEYYDSRDN